VIRLDLSCFIYSMFPPNVPTCIYIVGYPRSFLTLIRHMKSRVAKWNLAWVSSQCCQLQ